MGVLCMSSVRHRMRAKVRGARQERPTCPGGLFGKPALRRGLST